MEGIITQLTEVLRSDAKSETFQPIIREDYEREGNNNGFMALSGLISTCAFLLVIYLFIYLNRQHVHNRE